MNQGYPGSQVSGKRDQARAVGGGLGDQPDRLVDPGVEVEELGGGLDGGGPEPGVLDAHA